LHQISLVKKKEKRRKESMKIQRWLRRKEGEKANIAGRGRRCFCWERPIWVIGGRVSTPKEGADRRLFCRRRVLEGRGKEEVVRFSILLLEGVGGILRKLAVIFCTWEGGGRGKWGGLYIQILIIGEEGEKKGIYVYRRRGWKYSTLSYHEEK